MSTTTNLTTALARLEKYNAAYDTLMAKDNEALSAKEAAELQFLENTKLIRDQAHQAVT